MKQGREVIGDGSRRKEECTGKKRKRNGTTKYQLRNRFKMTRRRGARRVPYILHHTTGHEQISQGDLFARAFFHIGQEMNVSQDLGWLTGEGRGNLGKERW